MGKQASLPSMGAGNATHSNQGRKMVHGYGWGNSVKRTRSLSEFSQKCGQVVPHQYYTHTHKRERENLHNRYTRHIRDTDAAEGDTKK